MSQTQLENKVEDYLRKSRAVEDYWHRPITAKELQAEMDRMAQHTRQPEVLGELFRSARERSLCHRRMSGQANGRATFAHRAGRSRHDAPVRAAKAN